MDSICVTDVTKTYTAKKSRQGLRGKVRDLISPEKTYIEVLRGVNLNVNAGECLGFLGPNGAGKSTLTKILCGLQMPTSGHVEVMGKNPAEKKRDFFLNLGVVFGHKSSLWWDLPVEESLKCAKVVYDINPSEFAKNYKELTESLQIEDILNRPVRLLSLGERVKAELAANMLHNPKVLLLDEPTIGLDVVSKAQLRRHIRHWAKTYGTAVFLTSHDVGDIESCCDRITLVEGGKTAFNGPINNFHLEMNDFCIVNIKNNNRPLADEEVAKIRDIARATSDRTLEIHEKSESIDITIPTKLQSKVIGELGKVEAEFELSTRRLSLEEGLAKRFTEK